MRFYELSGKHPWPTAVADCVPHVLIGTSTENGGRDERILLGCRIMDKPVAPVKVELLTAMQVKERLRSIYRPAWKDGKQVDAAMVDRLEKQGY